MFMFIVSAKKVYSTFEQRFESWELATQKFDELKLMGWTCELHARPRS